MATGPDFEEKEREKDDDELDEPARIPNDPEEDMEDDNQPEYTISIEYDEFLTRLDFDEVLKSIDRIIEDELLDYYYPEFRISARRSRLGRLGLIRESQEPEFSYIGIKSVEAGSVLLTVFVGGAVLGYVAKRFKKGVDESLFAEELQRTGRMAGDVFGSVLSRVNDWAERYVPKQTELGGRVTKITARRKKKPTEEKQ